jgi:hypothetical protein
VVICFFHEIQQPVAVIALGENTGKILQEDVGQHQGSRRPIVPNDEEGHTENDDCVDQLGPAAFGQEFTQVGWLSGRHAFFPEGTAIRQAFLPGSYVKHGLVYASFPAPGPVESRPGIETVPGDERADKARGQVHQQPGRAIDQDNLEDSGQAEDVHEGLFRRTRMVRSFQTTRRSINEEKAENKNKRMKKSRGTGYNSKAAGEKLPMRRLKKAA